MRLATLRTENGTSAARIVSDSEVVLLPFGDVGALLAQELSLIHI